MFQVLEQKSPFIVPESCLDRSGPARDISWNLSMLSRCEKVDTCWGMMSGVGNLGQGWGYKCGLQPARASQVCTSFEGVGNRQRIRGQWEHTKLGGLARTGTNTDE